MFNNLSSLFHTIFVGALAYLAVVALLRLSGKRTLSKWNAFDFVVTIAYGSILATIVLSKQTSLLQGLLGLTILLALQFCMTWIAARSTLMQQLAKAQPTLLLYRGKFQAKAMKQERVTEGEVRAAIRTQGKSTLSEIDAVVLETDGSFSVLPIISSGEDSAMIDVIGYGNLAREPIETTI